MPSHPSPRRGEDSLLEIAGAAVPFLSTTNQVHVSVPTGPTSQQICALRSPQLKQWLRVRYEHHYSVPPSESWLRSSLDRFEARAVYSDRPAERVGTRSIKYDDRVVLDLAGATGQCVEMTAAGWQTSNALPYAFTRPSGMVPLPEPCHAPAAADSLDEFRALLNIPAGNDWTRVLTFLTAALAGLGPCPILVLQGPSGSGKTAAARMLQSLIDPSIGTPGPLPGSIAAIRKHAEGHHVLVFDDVHRIGPVKASEIARLADSEEQPHAVILIRACGSLAALPEALQQRALLVTLAEPESLRTLYDLKREFERIHPVVLGALCDAVCESLERPHTTAQPPLVRLADATVLALAAAPALGLHPAAILQASAETPLVRSSPHLPGAAADVIF